MIVLDADNIKSSVIATRAMSEIPTPLREDLVVFGLARIVAYGTALPAAPVENPVSFFADNSKNAKGIISQVNEKTVVNMSKVIGMAGVIYRARYDMVFAPYSKASLALAQSALVAAGQYDFPQAIADALALGDASNDMARSISFALNMFAINDVAVLDEAAAAE